MLNSGTGSQGNPAGLKSIQSSQQAFAVQLQELYNRILMLETKNKELKELIDEEGQLRIDSYLELKQKDNMLDSDICKVSVNVKSVEEQLNAILNN